MSNLQVFKNNEFGEIRALEIEGEPWLVGRDVAKTLGYKDTSDALKKHVDVDDKMTLQITDSLGRLQETYIINESGLYSLILSSKLPCKAVIQHCKGIRKLGIPSEGGIQKTNVIPEGGIKVE